MSSTAAEPSPPVPAAVRTGPADAGLLGAFTLVGSELAADMSEDAVNPVRSVPRGVPWAVGGSVVLGMIALIGFTLAIPISRRSRARLVYSMSRDNMLPFSRSLRKINARSQTPVVALLVFGVSDLGVMIYGYNQPSAFGTTDSLPGASNLGRCGTSAACCGGSRRAPPASSPSRT